MAETLTERVELRVSLRTLQRVRAAASGRDTSLGAWVRAAIERQLAAEAADRREAAEALFAIGVSVMDWPEMEREIEAARRPEVP